MLNHISTGLTGFLSGRRFSMALNWLPVSLGQQQEPLHRAVLSLIRMVLGEPHTPSGEDIEFIRSLLREFRVSDSALPLNELPEADLLPMPEMAAVFNSLSPEKKLDLLTISAVIAIRRGTLERCYDFLHSLAEELGIPGEKLDAVTAEQKKHWEQRRRIISSGAGIAVALIVIVIFILTATLLRSLIFGLILAFVMLPLEQFFERRLADRKSALSLIFSSLAVIFTPFRKISSLFSRREGREKNSLDKARTARAVSLTAAVLISVLTAGLLFFSMMSLHYIDNFKTRHQQEISAAVAVIAPKKANVQTTGKPENKPQIQTAVNPPPPQDESFFAPVKHKINSIRRKFSSMTAQQTQTAIPAEKAADDDSRQLETLFAPLLRGLDRLRVKFDSIPLIRMMLDETAKLLDDESSQREIAGMLLKRSGGVLSFAAGVAGWICNIIFDILLTIFFFLLLLTKLADFKRTNRGKDSNMGRYLVQSVFDSSWLPGAREGALAEADRIIGEVIYKLKMWCRGYCILILIDSTVYTSVFYILNVPYFFLLGPLAGCGILLPYLGPVASACITLLVTLAAGGAGASSMQLLGILAAYLIYNGIIEQFILYPLVIGGSLGLTTLETIIVVLLGAIFAGITGMILAIPAAAVLKYLVPQIYRCFSPKARLQEE